MTLGDKCWLCMQNIVYQFNSKETIKHGSIAQNSTANTTLPNDLEPLLQSKFEKVEDTYQLNQFICNLKSDLQIQNHFTSIFSSLQSFQYQISKSGSQTLINKFLELLNRIFESRNTMNCNNSVVTPKKLFQQSLISDNPTIRSVNRMEKEGRESNLPQHETLQTIKGSYKTIDRKQRSWKDQLIIEDFSYDQTDGFGQSQRYPNCPRIDFNKNQIKSNVLSQFEGDENESLKRQLNSKEKKFYGIILHEQNYQQEKQHVNQRTQTINGQQFKVQSQGQSQFLRTQTMPQQVLPQYLNSDEVANSKTFSSNDVQKVKKLNFYVQDLIKSNLQMLTKQISTQNTNFQGQLTSQVKKSQISNTNQMDMNIKNIDHKDQEINLKTEKCKMYQEIASQDRLIQSASPKLQLSQQSSQDNDNESGTKSKFAKLWNNHVSSSSRQIDVQILQTINSESDMILQRTKSLAIDSIIEQEKEQKDPMSPTFGKKGNYTQDMRKADNYYSLDNSDPGEMSRINLFKNKSQKSPIQEYYQDSIISEEFGEEAEQRELNSQQKTLFTSQRSVQVNHIGDRPQKNNTIQAQSAKNRQMKLNGLFSRFPKNEIAKTMLSVDFVPKKRKVSPESRAFNIISND